jgi:hypothetical protein
MARKRLRRDRNALKATDGNKRHDKETSQVNSRRYFSELPSGLAKHHLQVSAGLQTQIPSQLPHNQIQSALRHEGALIGHDAFRIHQFFGTLHWVSEASFTKSPGHADSQAKF